MYLALPFIYLSILFLVAFFSILLLMKRGGKQQDFLCLYLCISFSLECLMFLIQRFFNDNSTFGFLYNIYILFCSFFFLKYFNREQKREFTLFSNIIFLSFFILYIIFFYKSYKEVNQAIGISFALVYIIYSLLYFYGKIKYPDSKSITSDPKFWVSCALLFWGVFFLLRIIPRYLFDKMDEQVLIISQSFFLVINILFYSFFFISLIKYSKKYE